MPGQLSFGTRALLGYGAVVLLPTVGMLFTVRRFEAVSEDQLARVRAEQREILRAERLRRDGEWVASVGRGYLITGHPDLLARLHEAKDGFDANVRSLGA